jgi:hypothetical protein
MEKIKGKIKGEKERNEIKNKNERHLEGSRGVAQCYHKTDTIRLSPCPIRYNNNLFLYLSVSPENWIQPHSCYSLSGLLKRSRVTLKVLQPRPGPKTNLGDMRKQG